MKLPIYLDYAATTPVDKRVAKKMIQYLTIDGVFGNPSSRSHRYGWHAQEAVEIARTQVSSLIGANSNEIIFTSGATESNNLAIKGIAQANHKKGRHIITSAIEHKSVLDTCNELEEHHDFIITRLKPESNGLIDLEKFKNAFRHDTILVSIMHVNNEIGIIQNISLLGSICKQKNVIFHVDATQSIGKIPINLSELSVDLMSFSCHKLYGPKGIGSLYIKSQKPSISIKAQIHGGGHENGIRSGTLPVHQIVGMGESFKIASKDILKNSEKLRRLRDRLWIGLKKISGIVLNSDLKNGITTLLNVSFNSIDVESLIFVLKDLAISSGSACTSINKKPSHVLRAIGLNDNLAYNSCRFSIGRFTTIEEIDFSIETINTAITCRNSKFVKS